MNPFNKLIRVMLPTVAILFVACSPQRKVQQYSYLVKHKTPKNMLASTSVEADPNLRPPISISTTERKLAPKEGNYVSKTSSLKEKHSISKTDRKVMPQEKSYTFQTASTSLSTTERKVMPQEETNAAKTSLSQKAYSLSTTERKFMPEEETYISKPRPAKEKNPLSKTDVKESINVSQIEAPKVSISTTSVKPLSLKRQEREKIIKTADRFLGTPYKFAGMTQQGIDCSGLICQAYSAVDIALPRNSWAMAKSGKAIPIEEVAPGHLLFFHSYKGKGINHVAMVSKVSDSDIEFIHATVGKGVRKDKLSDSYWKERFRIAVIPGDSKKKNTAP